MRTRLTTIALLLGSLTLSACNTSAPQVERPSAPNTSPSETGPTLNVIYDGEGTVQLETCILPEQIDPTNAPAAAYCSVSVTTMGGTVLSTPTTFTLEEGGEYTLTINEYPNAIVTQFTDYQLEVPGTEFGELTSQGSHNQFRGYHPDRAAAYARDYYNVGYGSSNPFGNYRNLGGNCTNFVNQAILAGLMLNGGDPHYVYKYRDWFYDESGSYHLYWKHDGNRAPAWTGANEFRNYAAAQNNIAYSGINFNFVTGDSPNSLLNLGAIHVGDIVTADLDGNGTSDHSMMVTGIDPHASSASNGYGRILVSYQNAAGYDNRVNYPLSNLNGRNVVFRVYRPVGYTP